jgi:hypothetical protein
MSAISDLANYVQEHAIRGTCTCGECVDRPEVDSQPTGHTADVVFFQVANKGADTEELRTLITAAKEGEFGNIDLFDGKEHSFIELGGWIGSQDVALTLMGLGTVLNLWKLLTPKTFGLPQDVAMKMAQVGLVTIRSSVSEKS